MTKTKRVIFICTFLLTSFTSFASVKTGPKKDANTQDYVEQLEKRVYEIWDMDFSNMDKETKSQVKIELKEIKKELKRKDLELDKKVSISVGAIIIILLLIIIIT